MKQGWAGFAPDVEYTPRRLVGGDWGWTRLDSSGFEFKLKLERYMRELGDLQSGHRTEPMRSWHGHLKTPGMPREVSGRLRGWVEVEAINI